MIKDFHGLGFEILKIVARDEVDDVNGPVRSKFDTFEAFYEAEQACFKNLRQRAANLFETRHAIAETIGLQGVKIYPWGMVIAPANILVHPNNTYNTRPTN